MIEVVDVTGDDEGPATEGPDVGRDAVQLLAGPGGEHDVGTGFGEGPGRAGADPAPGAGHDRGAAVEAEPVEEHGRTLPGRYVLRITVTVDDTPTPAQLDALYDAVRNSGRWAPKTAPARSPSSPTRGGRRGHGSVRAGVTVSLAHTLPVNPSPETPSPAHHHMLASGDALRLERYRGIRGQRRDYVGTEVHGMGITHLDALCHMFVRGLMYNGRAADQVTSTGALANDVMATGDGLVGPRCAARHPTRARGVDFLPGNEPITVADLEAAEAAQGSPVRSGDLLIVGGGARHAQGCAGRAARPVRRRSRRSAPRRPCRGSTSVRSRCSRATASPT